MKNKKKLLKSLAAKAEKNGWGIAELLEYLIRANMVSESAGDAYLAVEAYPDFLQATVTPSEPRGVKRLAVWEISEYLGRAESTVWGYLAHHSARFHE